MCIFDKYVPNTYDFTFEKNRKFNCDILTNSDDTFDNWVTDKLFKAITQKIANDERGLNWLALVSVCGQWNMFSDLTGIHFENGDLQKYKGGCVKNNNSIEWNFAECNKRQLEKGSLTWKLKQKYGIGTSCNSSWYWENGGDLNKGITDYLHYMLSNVGDSANA